jgi:type I restriction enzyme, S subunit
LKTSLIINLKRISVIILTPKMPINHTTYTCNICDHTTSQHSHHASHLKTDKHKQEKKIRKLEIEKLSEEERMEQYQTNCINDILDSLETKKIDKRKKKIIVKSNTMSEYIKFQYVPTNILKWNLEYDMELNIQYDTLKKKVESVVKQCHKVLYSNGSIVGIKAMNDIVRILVLKFLESQFQDETSEIWGLIEQKKEELKLSQSKFEKYTNLCKNLKNFEEEQHKIQSWKLLVKQLLSKIIPDIFQEEDESFNFKDDAVFMELISKISTLDITEDFVNTYSTACGDIHEAFRAYGGKKGAKELGQFFTPRKLIHLIFHGLELNELCEDLEEPEIFDPCMGTGGFLTRIYKLMNIKPENIYGCETELDTIKFAFSSVQLTTGKAVSKLHKCDSLCESEGLDTKKHHIIVTNPPFGTNMKYTDLKSKYELNFPDAENKFEDIYPIKTNNGACLFTQMCVHKLEVGGVCAIVLPNGELFNGDGWSSRFREWLCDNVNIRTMLKAPNGTFDHAGVKTNVVIFTKDGPTQDVRFLQTTKDCDEVKELFTVPREDLEKTGFNLDSDRYEKHEEETYDVPVVTLGEVCEFEPKSKRSAKYGNKTGPYPFYKSSLVVNSFVDEPDFTEESLIIGDGGNANINYSSTFSTSDHCYVFKSIDDRITNKYIYNYIIYNLHKLEKYYTGSGLKNISKQNIKKLEIPLPSLEVQNRIVDELTQLKESINTIQTRIEQLSREKEQSRKYYRKGEINNLLRDSESKLLGDVCQMLPTTKHYSSIGKKEGLYKFYVSSQKCNLYLDTYEVEDLSIIIGNGGQPNIHIDCKFTPSKHVTVCKIDNPNLSIQYIYYYLSYNLDILNKLFSGCGLKWVNKTKLSNIKIPLPSLEVQQQCVEIYQSKEAKLKEYDDKIEQQQQYIEELKVLGKDIINSFCNSS